MTREAAHCLWRLTRLDYLLSCLPSGPTVRGLRQRPRRRVIESGTARSLGVPASASLSSPSNLPGGVAGGGRACCTPIHVSAPWHPRLLRELSDSKPQHVVGVWGRLPVMSVCVATGPCSRSY